MGLGEGCVELVEDSSLQATVHLLIPAFEASELGNGHATVPPAGYKDVAQRL